ncbi:hypothetical protein Ancab_014750 [Ancistrocladus abbreviatus]
MPSQTQPGKEALGPGGDIVHSLELKRSPKPHHTCKNAKEKALSPRAYRSVKFKDKLKAEIPIRPPHADIPFEFVKNGANRVLVRTNSSGSQQQQQVGKKTGKEGEIIKYMSYLPAYLQRGEKLQDNVLSFGVLDWERLEKWKHIQNQCSKGDKTRPALTASTSSMSKAGSSISSSAVKNEALLHQRSKVSHSHVNSCHNVLTSGDKLLDEKVMSQQVCRTCPGYKTDAQQRICKEDKSCGDTLKMKFSSGKERDSDKRKSFSGETSSNLNSEVLLSSREKVNAMDGELENTFEKFWGTYDPAHQHCPRKQERVILLLPKDFSRSGGLEMCQRTSLDEKSAEPHWNSFSDVFCVAEVDSEESFSEVPYSCPLPCTIETEKDLDMKLEKLIKSQDVKLSFNVPMFPHLDEKHHDVKQEPDNAKDTTGSATCETSKGLDQKAGNLKAGKTKDLSATCHYSLGVGRMTRSVSFREGSTIPPLRSTNVSFMSGPALPEASASANSNSKTTNANGRTRSSPLRRLLDPLLKPKVGKLFNPPENGEQCTQQLNDFSINPLSASECQNDNCGASTVGAFLQLTTKNELPLFRFVVETNGEVLASTVKKLYVSVDDDPSWLYTFYSVHKLIRKSGHWRNQGRKGKRSEFSYNVVGHMKVSNSQLPDFLNCGEKYMERESVLYGVHLTPGVGEAASKSMASKELAAIIIKMPNQRYKHDSGKFDKDSDLKHGAFSDCSEDGYSNGPDEGGISGNIVVILPRGTHSLPNEGGPSSLTSRWRSGGSCDCGGWDVGCKLQILINGGENCMIHGPSNTSSQQDRWDLFLKGGTKQRGPTFSLVQYRNGFYSVEFDDSISKLQAFAICIAVINGHSYTDLLDANDSGERKQGLQGGHPARYATFPPLSPVGRV